MWSDKGVETWRNFEGVGFRGTGRFQGNMVYLRVATISLSSRCSSYSRVATAIRGKASK